MNNVLYHLHPVKVKRHGVKLSYTLCLGGFSFFLFILLTITGIFLMFYYTPTTEAAYRTSSGSRPTWPSGPWCGTCTGGAPTSWCSRCSST
jgi:quinol-cytochrome oxidoreductase complex cytochrome b subunit